MVQGVEVRIQPVSDSGPPDADARAGGPMPRRASESAAGFDLLAWIPTPVTIEAGAWAKISCGFAMELPAGYEAQVRPRSGLALKHGITLLNGPGTIDSDYRGEVCVILHNVGATPFVVEPGTRVAQLVVAALAPARLELVAALSESTRGVGGFGSTGVS